MTISNSAENQAISAMEKADDLIRQEKMHHPRPTPILLRCAEIESLEPWLRNKVIAETIREVSRQPFMLSFDLFWIFACIFAFIQFVPAHYQLAALPALAIGMVVPMLLLLAAITRQHILEKIRNWKEEGI